jgi:[ribosomal protein S5]-alanine N-acetyltransferase
VRDRAVVTDGPIHALRAASPRHNPRVVTGALDDGFELRNDRLVLRDFEPGDRSAFVEWAAHESMYTYMAWRLNGRAAAEAEFQRLLSHPEYKNPARRRWYLAVLTSAGEFCGTTGFEHRVDGLGELGWYLSSRHWGRGYATAATSLLLDFGFRSVGVPVITATCDPDNAASRRVLEKSRFRHVADETVDTWRGVRPRLRFQIPADDYLRA